MSPSESSAIMLLSAVIAQRFEENKGAGAGLWTAWRPDKYEVMEGLLRNVQGVATCIRHHEPDQLKREVADCAIYLAKVLELHGPEIYAHNRR